MSETPTKVIYDCNIFAQALIKLNGPAGRCVEKARDRTVQLFVSPFILAEIRELHEKLPAKYGVTEQQTDELAHVIASFATVVIDVPEIYRHPLDPDDSHYVNLAAKMDARLIVSRDRHLLNLMNAELKEAKAFLAQFPNLRILDPVELLRELEAGRPQT